MKVNHNEVVDEMKEGEEGIEVDNIDRNVKKCYAMKTAVWEDQIIFSINVWVGFFKYLNIFRLNCEPKMMLNFKNKFSAKKKLINFC